MKILVRVIASLTPGIWRVIVGPGMGLMDGGSEQDWPNEWIPGSARRPNGEFHISGFLEGVPRLYEESTKN
jgi:hypothetical protein